jgi:di/tricarboxylate transporter
MDILLLTAILIGGFALLVSGALRYEITALLVVFALSATGLLSPAEALSGFANEATITVAAMFVLSAGLSRTGAIEYITRAATRVRIRSTRMLLLVLIGLAAIPSAFLNNTAVVILLIPVVLKLCQRNQVSSSKLMIPLSYFTILGGTLTLMGTSTNILVHSLHQQAGGSGFEMFEFTKMGAVYLLVGGLFILVVGPKLLPERKVLSQLLEPQHRSRFVTEIVVPDKSRLSRATIGGVLSGLDEVRVLEHIRGEEVQLGPPASLEIESGDTLLVEGSPRAIHSLIAKQGLDLATAVADAQRVRISQMDLQIVEAVVTPTSSFFNQRLAELGLNRLYGIKVLAVQRRGRHIHERLREMKLQVGDVLLMQGEESSLYDLQNTGDVFLIEGVEKTIRIPRRAPLAVFIMACVVVGASFQWLPISVLAIGGAAAMLLSKCLRVREAIRSLESSVLLLIAATIPVGLAMQKTGMAETIARWVIGAAGGMGPTALVSAVYLFTMVFTEFLSNNAVAVLVVPVVLEIALKTGIDSKPLLVAVAFGASACFATPIGYQTNLLVMGPGGYYFRDYMRIGIALDLVLWIAATILIPYFWPLS